MQWKKFGFRAKYLDIYVVHSLCMSIWIWVGSLNSLGLSFFHSELMSLDYSVQFSHSTMSDSLWPHGVQHASSLSITNSQSLLKLTSMELVIPSISSSVVPFSSCLQSFPESGSCQMSQFFEKGGQNIGVSASASVLPKNVQDWFPLGWTGWLSLLSKRLSRVFSNTTVQKHQFFGAQLSL